MQTKRERHTDREREREKTHTDRETERESKVGTYFTDGFKSSGVQVFSGGGD